MSADNWAICPKCFANSDLDDEETFERTFREDYELGVLSDGEFYISYRGHCRTCGLSKEFKHSEQLKVQP